MDRNHAALRATQPPGKQSNSNWAGFFENSQCSRIGLEFLNLEFKSEKDFYGCYFEIIQEVEQQALFEMEEIDGMKRVLAYSQSRIEVYGQTLKYLKIIDSLKNYLSKENQERLNGMIVVLNDWFKKYM